MRGRPAPLLSRSHSLTLWLTRSESDSGRRDTPKVEVLPQATKCHGLLGIMLARPGLLRSLSHPLIPEHNSYARIPALPVSRPIICYVCVSFSLLPGELLSKVVSARVGVCEIPPGPYDRSCCQTTSPTPIRYCTQPVVTII